MNLISTLLFHGLKARKVYQWNVRDWTSLNVPMKHEGLEIISTTPSRSPLPLSILALACAYNFALVSFASKVSATLLLSTLPVTVFGISFSIHTWLCQHHPQVWKDYSPDLVPCTVPVSLPQMQQPPHLSLTHPLLAPQRLLPLGRTSPKVYQS